MGIVRSARRVRYLLAGVVVTAALHGAPAAADAEGAQASDDEVVDAAVTETRRRVTGELTVYGQRLRLLYGLGLARMDRAQIERLATGDGDLNRLLRVLPNVQFEEGRLDVRNLGEIEPSRVSISGGRFYENLFSVDGVSTSSALDPGGGGSQNAIDDTPGYAQSQFFDTELIDSLTVYDANVPARLGGFTGGVVEAETRGAGRHFRASVFVSGTSDDMVRFRVFPPPLDPEEVQDIEIRDPPQYRKYRYGGQVELPVGERTGVLLSAVQLESSIPELSLAEFQDRTRSNTNLLMNFDTEFAGYELRWGANYTPYRSNNFITDALNSDFTLQGGGYGSQLRLRGRTVLGETTVRASYAYSDNDREAPRDFFNWATSSSGPNWGERIFSLTSREGGFGDLQKTQRTVSLQLDVERPLGPGLAAWGLSVDRLDTEYFREETMYVYRSAVLDPRIRCLGEVVSACIDRNQALFTRTVYPADRATADLLQTSAFLEYDWRRTIWSARVGLRLDRDDFQENLNLAPRILFGIEPTSWLSMHVGLNRYYGRGLLTYRLREARRPFFTETRPARGVSVGNQILLLVEEDWRRAASAGSVVFEGSAGDLATPYSDEVAAGVSVPLLGGTGALRAVFRENRDEFSQQRSAVDPVTGLTTLRLTNDGSSSYRGVSFVWGRALIGDSALNLNVTWSQTRRTNATFDSRSSNELDNELVIFRDEIRPRGELDILADDFSRPVVANMSLFLPRRWGLQASVTGRYRQSFSNIGDSGRRENVILQECPDCPAGEVTLPVFDRIERPSTLLFDARLNWRTPTLVRHGAEIELLLDNLFSARTHTAQGANAWEAGLSAWVLIRYRFDGGQ